MVLAWTGLEMECSVHELGWSYSALGMGFAWTWL